MPLYDVRCESGHVTEVFVRGASAPLTCKDCGEEATRVPSMFAVHIGAVLPEHGPPVEDTNQRAKPKHISRAGGGVATKTEYGGYRPSLTHTATCPKEKRRRNVAVLGVLPHSRRVNCEACGWQWLHRASDAADPLLEGYDRTLAPGKKFSAHVAPGDQYVTAERGA